MPAPVAAPGEVVVDVERVGVCGTDLEFFTGAMTYLHQGHAGFRCGWATSGRAGCVRWVPGSNRAGSGAVSDNVSSVITGEIKGKAYSVRDALRPADAVGV